MYPEYQSYKNAPRAVAPDVDHNGLGVPTSPDIEGPFYKAGTPPWVNVPTPSLILRVDFVDVYGHLIPSAVADIWQADEKGEYDNAGYKLRGIATAGKDDEYMRGQFVITTVVPGDYQIADNPPDFRCAHIHFKLSAPGFKPLTTQLYFANDEHNSTDHWFDPKRVIRLDQMDPRYGEFTFVLEKE